MSETLLERVLRHEGFRTKPYLDTVGVSTFGHGLTYITKEESERIVHERLKSLEDLIVDNNLWLGLHPQVITDVLTEMAFQLGYSGLSKFVNMWKALEERDYETAADEGMNSKWARQTPERAKELTEIMRNIA